MKAALGVDNAIRTQSLYKANPFIHFDSGQRLALKRLEEHGILFYGNHNYNNAIGIQLGKDNPYTTLPSTFISKTKTKVRAGTMRRISNGTLIASSSYGEK